MIGNAQFATKMRMVCFASEHNKENINNNSNNNKKDNVQPRASNLLIQKGIASFCIQLITQNECL